MTLDLFLSKGLVENQSNLKYKSMVKKTKTKNEANILSCTAL